MVSIQERLSDRLINHAQELAGAEAKVVDESEFNLGIKEIKLMLAQLPADQLRD